MTSQYLVHIKPAEKQTRLIEIKQEDGSKFWTEKSFSFEEISEMEFVD